MKKLILFLSIFLFASFTNALICNPSYLNINQTLGSSSSASIVCTNSNTEDVIITKSNDLFTIDTSTIPGNGTKTINLNFNSITSAGTYLDTLAFSDGSNTFTMVLNVIKPEATLIIFPTSKVVTLEQGQTKTTSIQVIVPSDYPRPITVQSTSFNPDINVAQFGDLSLGVLNPGQTLNIPINVDSTNAQTGTYVTDISVLATDANGQINIPVSHLSVNIQATTNPTDSTTFQSKPICSLSAINLNLNNTYTLTCSGVTANVDVNPQANEYIEGLGVDLTSNTYVYRFRPTKFGVTTFNTLFSYKGSPIFTPYSQEVRISSSGVATDGTVLKLLFTPELTKAKASDNIILQLIDNKTGNLVLQPEIYIDAIPISLNGSSTFYLKMDYNKNYSFRARSPGYADLVQDLSLPNKPIAINITPTTGDSSTIYRIFTDINASLFLDTVKINNDYSGSIVAGTHEIKAIKDGYMDTTLNITISESTHSTLLTELKKGVEQVAQLSSNTTWEVYYLKDVTTPRQMIANGDSDKAIFTPKGAGIYTIESKGKVFGTYEIKSSTWEPLGYAWYWWLAGIAVIFIIYKLLRNKSSNPYAGDTNLIPR